MKKLRLDVEGLQVESFAADGTGPDGRGTVLGAGATLPIECATFTCGDSDLRPCQD